MLLALGAICHQCACTRTSWTPSFFQSPAANGPSMLPDSRRRSSSMSTSRPAAARAGAVAASTAAAVVASSNSMRADFIGERPPLRGTRFRSSADASSPPWLATLAVNWPLRELTVTVCTVWKAAPALAACWISTCSGVASGAGRACP